MSWRQAGKVPKDSCLGGQGSLVERIDPGTSIPRIAWPTVALLAGLSALATLGVVGGLAGFVPVVAAVAAIAVADYAAFTVMHEASHGLVGRDRPLLNQLVGEACALLLWCRFNGFRQVHLVHHTHTGDPQRDPDTYAGGGPRWLLPLRWATADLNYWREFDTSAPMTRIERVTSDVTLGMLVLGVVFAVAQGWGLELLVYWVLPARLALFVSTYFFDYLPHQRPHTVSRRDNPAQCSAVLRGGPALDALLLGHTLHLVHHLYPCVPFYRLRAVYTPRRARLLQRGTREVWPFTRPRPYDSQPAIAALPPRSVESAPAA